MLLFFLRENSRTRAGHIVTQEVPQCQRAYNTWLKARVGGTGDTVIPPPRARGWWLADGRRQSATSIPRAALAHSRGEDVTKAKGGSSKCGIHDCLCRLLCASIARCRKREREGQRQRQREWQMGSCVAVFAQHNLYVQSHNQYSY